jgi:GT2 family glycosyltransferase
METSTPDVSIVIVGWRDAPELPGCLAELARTASTASREVVVALNEPTPELVDALSNQPDLYDVLDVSSENRGFGIANNDAARLATGRLLFFLNDDARVTPGWLDPLVVRLDADRSIGAVGSVQVDDEGRIAEAGAFVYADAAPVQIDATILGGAAPEAGPVLYVSGAALMVRRGEFDELGGFDPGYHPAYYEDADLSLKLLGAGLTTWVEPTSVVRHHYGASANRRYAGFLTEANRARFTERWPEALQSLPPHAATFRIAHVRQDVVAVAAAIAQLAEGPRFSASVPDAPRPDGGWLAERASALVATYAAELAAQLDVAEERIRELEAREAHLQVLVAERQDVLDRLVPHAEELEVRIKALDDELGAILQRTVVRAADKAAGLVRRVARS